MGGYGRSEMFALAGNGRFLWGFESRGVLECESLPYVDNNEISKDH
jgi:hypothetical protein